MPDLNDFYAFESTSSGRGGGSGGSKFPWVLGILAVLWLISKLFG